MTEKNANVDATAKRLAEIAKLCSSVGHDMRVIDCMRRNIAEESEINRGIINMLAEYICKFGFKVRDRNHNHMRCFRDAICLANSCRQGECKFFTKQELNDILNSIDEIFEGGPNG